MTGGRGAAALLVVLLAGAGRAAPPAAARPPSKLAELGRILESRDDNDSRLDTDFNRLNAREKAQFRARYRRLPRERLNERGTIVYLLGKNVTTARDWAFLRSVAAEPPCLSLSDCAKAPAPGEAGAPGDEVTLAYPALVALKQAERALAAARRSKNAAPPGARAVVEAGRRSGARPVRRLAERLSRRFVN